MRLMPEDVKDIMGRQIDDFQAGLFPAGARPFGEGLPSDVVKLAVNTDGETYRCACVAAFRGVIYVLHVFRKKSKSGVRTPKEDRHRIALRYRAAKQHYHENMAAYALIAAPKSER